MDEPTTLPPAVRAGILRWYGEHRRTLAFRRTSDPYGVLVSEAMAQQTRAERAAAYWERFMERFPTVEALASATPADVLRAWQGLGYDRRGLALWRAARVIRDEHGGRVPASIEALEALPGVGPYTARAVAAIAFGRPVGAVDVNVRRVLCRIVGGSKRLPPKDVQALADAAVPAADPATWTHALMDLGATVCRSRVPRCDECPVREMCRYAASVAPTPDPRPISRPAAAPFSATNRWLRGRILDRLRAAAGDAWVDLDAPIGSHDVSRVRAAATALAGDGLVELDGRDPGPVRARLATA